MKGGLEVKAYGSFHHPHVKTSSSDRVFCSPAEQYKLILGMVGPTARGPQNHTSQDSLC